VPRGYYRDLPTSAGAPVQHGHHGPRSGSGYARAEFFVVVLCAAGRAGAHAFHFLRDPALSVGQLRGSCFLLSSSQKSENYGEEGSHLGIFCTVYKTVPLFERLGRLNEEASGEEAQSRTRSWVLSRFFDAPNLRWPSLAVIKTLKFLCSHSPLDE
jgi:hypothetical protein